VRGRRMTGGQRPLLWAGGLLAAVLAAGCSAGTPARYRATTSTCFAFSVQALQQHVTVTTVPRACAGLSHEQIDLAVTRAVREVAGPQTKVAGRRVARRELTYLVHLIQAVPVPAPAPPAAAPAQRPPGSPLRLAALAAWIVTAAAGSWLIAGWLVHGGLRQRGTRVAGVPRAVVIGHFGLALTGLGVWIAYVVTGVPALAWAGVGVILSVAGLGMATLAGGLPEAAADTGLAVPGPPAADPLAAGPPVAARTAVTEAPAQVRAPVALIAVHGMLAATAILLVVLAAAGA
jgi:manganese efflux pump family protein